MRLLPSYLQRRGTGTFHLRIAVPNDVRTYFKQREIKRSLATKDAAAAIILAQKLRQSAEEAFRTCRNMSKEDSGFLRHIYLELSKPDGTKHVVKVERDDPYEEAKIGAELLIALHSVSTDSSSAPAVSEPLPAKPSLSKLFQNYVAERLREKASAPKTQAEAAGAFESPRVSRRLFGSSYAAIAAG
jgi:hypothetical protein